MLILAAFVFAISFSITNIMSLILEIIFRKSSYVNFLGTLVLILFQIAFIIYWLPLIAFLRILIVSGIVLIGEPRYLLHIKNPLFIIGDFHLKKAAITCDRRAAPLIIFSAERAAFKFG